MALDSGGGRSESGFAVEASPECARDWPFDDFGLPFSFLRDDMMVETMKNRGAVRMERKSAGMSTKLQAYQAGGPGLFLSAWLSVT
jgi:hypothetical protein